MSRPKIKTALAGILILLGTAFATFATFAVNRLGTINNNVTLLARDNLPTAVAVKDMEVQLGEIRTSYRSHILRSDTEGKTAAAASIVKAIKMLKNDIGTFNSLNPTGEEAELVANVGKAIDQYAQTGERVLAASSAGDLEGANKILREEMVKSADAARAAVTRLVELSNQSASEAYGLAAAAYSATITITFISIGLLALLIIGAMWFAVAGIAKPIQAITSSMENLASGDADTPVPFDGRTDEIGDMAAAVDVFRKNALENKRLEREAQTQRNLTEEQRRRSAEQDRIRAEQMAQATEGLAEGLKHLADGNLSFQLENEFAHDFEGLRADFNRAIAQLRETLASVSQSTASIDGGSKEVSQSADDLSKRTEQQAASLEETAAALDQITTNVSNSTKRAEEARALAAQANASASQSGAVVANAVAAMGRIEQSSSQISNIIGVIDEIAFQTNLLALNAGVEAARAGDAGKGFAVVAQEVRELAQRSAQAAKEIKELIRNSAVEVENGVKLVSETGKALKTIENYIVTINDHMNSIATSAREQSVGLNEVNTAVNQMDQVTQQNAAMVEEANAAGANLAAEANRLRQLVSQFQIDTMASTEAALLKQTAVAMAARSQHRTVPSPARTFAGKIARALGSAAPAVSEDSWEEF